MVWRDSFFGSAWKDSGLEYVVEAHLCHGKPLIGAKSAIDSLEVEKANWVCLSRGDPSPRMAAFLVVLVSL